VIFPLSPLIIAPYQTELYSPKLTSPTMHALGAINRAELTSGAIFLKLFYLKDGMTFLLLIYNVNIIILIKIFTSIIIS